MWPLNVKNAEIQTEYVTMCLRYSHPDNEHYFNDALILLEKDDITQEDWEKAGKLAQQGRSAEQNLAFENGEIPIEPFAV